MKPSVIKICFVILIMIVIPAVSILVSKGNARFSSEDLDFSGIPGKLTVYYLLMTAIAVIFSIIRKIIAYLNREE